MKAFNIFFLLFIVFSLFSRAFAIHETTPAETQLVMPGADAAQVYAYITKGKPYTQWDLWPGKGRMYPGTQPHGDFLTTYINETGRFDLKNGKGSFSEGTIIVKENYGSDRGISALSVMYKIAGFNASAGDWFWAKYDGSGKVLASGRAEACIKCHEAKKDNDYMYTGQMMK